MPEPVVSRERSLDPRDLRGDGAGETRGEVDWEQVGEDDLELALCEREEVCWPVSVVRTVREVVEDGFLKTGDEEGWEWEEEAFGLCETVDASDTVETARDAFSNRSKYALGRRELSTNKIVEEGLSWTSV